MEQRFVSSLWLRCLHIRRLTRTSAFNFSIYSVLRDVGDSLYTFVAFAVVYNDNDGGKKSLIFLSVITYARNIHTHHLLANQADSKAKM